jgi:hypothetical protein
MEAKEPWVTPFTILVDSNEGSPFSFGGLTTNAAKGNRPIAVKTEFQSLGRYPNSKGDYSLKGYVGTIGIERKSIEDAWATLLGWPTRQEKNRDGASRRDRFKSEMENLNAMQCAEVVVEASLGDCLNAVPEYTEKPHDVCRKIFFNTIVSCRYNYPHVAWTFCDSRHMAESWVYKLLAKFWKEETI